MSIMKVWDYQIFVKSYQHYNNKIVVFKIISILISKMSLSVTSTTPEFCKTCVHSIPIPWNWDTVHDVCVLVSFESWRIVCNSIKPYQSVESRNPTASLPMLCQHYRGDMIKIEKLNWIQLDTIVTQARLQKILYSSGIHTVEQLIEVWIEWVCRLFRLSRDQRNELEAIVLAHSMSKKT